jgi:hypothetical protein
LARLFSGAPLTLFNEDVLQIQSTIGWSVEEGVRHPRAYGVSLSGAFDQTGELYEQEPEKTLITE